jgi:predicted ATPase
MRIAVSGTHGVGKSTLIDEFLRVHPEFVHEPEPYTVMVEDFGEEFSAEPCVEDFVRQVEFNIVRLHQHARGENVIYERCPVDFLAYIQALNPEIADELREEVSEAVRHLELILYLPLEEVFREDEFPKLQRAVDHTLRAIFRDDDIGCTNSVVEAEGSTAQRLITLEKAIRSQPT